MPRSPSTGPVTSPFGPRESPIAGASTNHLGEDTIGAGNYAPATGQVQFAGPYGGWGNVVGIRELNDGNVVWWVAHHKRIDVEVGQWVTEGDYLGPMGMTGTATGDHAHTERRVGGASVPGSGIATNPRDYYFALAGGGGRPAGAPKRKDTLMHIVDVDGQYYQIGASFISKPRETEEGKNLMTALYGAPIPLEPAQLDEALSNHGIPWDVPGQLQAGQAWDRGKFQ